MNDQENPEPGFDDPAYDDLRALLADARATAPVPDDVAARLDATLASLTADRRDAAGAEPTVVVPLRRRSRVGSRLLAAAAAVVIVGAGGIGISEVLRTTGSDDATVTADSAAPSSEHDFGPESAPEDPAPASTGAPLALDYSLNNLSRLTATILPKFTSAGFATEAAEFRTTALASSFSATAESAEPGIGDNSADPTERDQTGSGTGASGPQSGNVDGVTKDSRTTAKNLRGSYYSAAKTACPGPVGTAATSVPIQYDGAPASLLIHPATTEGQLYEAWSCDGTTLLASTVVPR